MGKEDKQVKQHYYVTEMVLNVYIMTILAKDCHVKMNGESVYLHGRHVTGFLMNSCMFAYE